MRTQLQITREYPLPRRTLYEFLLDPANWTRYYNNVEGIEDGNRLRESGDRTVFRYRILGRSVSLAAELTDVKPGRSARVELGGKGIPDVSHEWTFQDCAAGTRVTVTLETEESTDWFGTPVDRLTVSRAFERDLTRSLDNVSDLIRLGID